MHKSASNNTVTETSSAPLNFFERAKQRVFGKRDAATTTLAAIPASDASHRPANPAAAMTRAIAEEKAAVLETPPPRPKAAAVHRAIVAASPALQALQNRSASLATALPGFYSKDSDFTLVSRVYDGLHASKADKETATAELLNRGFEIADDGRVNLPMALFEAMTPVEKDDVMKARVRLVGVSQSSVLYGAENPVGYATARELTFPEPPKTKPRTWKQYMNFSAEEVKKLAEETGNNRFGKEARVEFYDAYCSMSPASWRNPNRENDQTARGKFYQKFKESLVHCNNFGPRSESPNDPAPPVDPGAMTARELLALPLEAREGLWKEMRQQWAGRKVRAELKRAYRAGSSADRQALRAIFELSLTSFPEEQI